MLLLLARLLLGMVLGTALRRFWLVLALVTVASGFGGAAGLNASGLAAADVAHVLLCFVAGVWGGRIAGSGRLGRLRLILLAGSGVCSALLFELAGADGIARATGVSAGPGGAAHPGGPPHRR